MNLELTPEEFLLVACIIQQSLDDLGTLPVSSPSQYTFYLTLKTANDKLQSSLAETHRPKHV